MGEIISGKQDGTSITIEGPPGPHKYNNIYIYMYIYINHSVVNIHMYEKLVVLIVSYGPCISSVRRCTRAKILLHRI